MNVEVRCPSCSKRGMIEITPETINGMTRGVVAVYLEKNRICSHSFTAYIDKNLDVRDCFIVDFQIVLPQKEIAQKIEEKNIPNSDDIDVFLIKMNMPALLLTSIIRGCLIKKKLLILNEKEYLQNQIFNFFEFIFQNSFETDIITINREDYKKNKKKFNNYIVFDENKILNDKNKILDPNKIKIERIVVQKFLAEYDNKASLIIVRNEIQKLYEISRELMQIINNYKGIEKMSKRELINKYKKINKIKLPSSYLEFILDILKNYFNFDISVLSDYYFPGLGI